MQTTDINDAWAGKRAHMLLSRIGPYKLFYWDIGQAGPNQELESEVKNTSAQSVQVIFDIISHIQGFFSCILLLKGCLIFSDEEIQQSPSGRGPV